MVTTHAICRVIFFFRRLCIQSLALVLEGLGDGQMITLRERSPNGLAALFHCFISMADGIRGGLLWSACLWEVRLLLLPPVSAEKGRHRNPAANSRNHDLVIRMINDSTESAVKSGQQTFELQTALDEKHP